MERLSGRDFLACLEFLRRVYAARSLDDFAAAVLSGVPRLVHAELTAYNEYNPARNRNRYLVDRPEAAPPVGAAVFNSFIHEHPIIRYYRKTRDGRALKISDFLVASQYHRLGLYNEFFRLAHPPAEDLMAFHFLWRRNRALAMALCRAKRSFTERDRFLLNLLRPHLTQAYLNAEAAEVQGLVNRALGELNESVIAFDEHLRVRWTSDALPKLLGSYFGSSARGGRCAPDALLQWVKHELASLDGSDTVPAPRFPLVVARTNRRLLVRLVRQADGCVVVLREQSTSFDPDLLEPLGLTRREREVLAWVAQGKSDTEIAEILGMRMRTVEKHLEHVYTKLGVENRTAAASRAVDCFSLARS